MATQAEITLKIKVDKGEAEKNLNSITNELNDVRKAQTDLNNAFKTGNIGADEYSKKMNELRVKTQELQAQQTLATKVIVAQKGSINELSNALALNKKAYNALSEEQRNNVNVGGKLKKTINEQQSSLGDLTKTVGGGGLRGGITSAFKGMASSLVAAGVAFISVQGAAKAFNYVISQGGDASDKLEETLGGLSSAVKSIAIDILSLNFKNLITNAKDAAEEGKNYIATKQDIDDRAYIANQKRYRIERDIIDLEKERAPLSRKNLETSQQYIDLTSKINEKLVEKAQLNKDIAKDEFDNLIGYASISSKLEKTYGNLSKDDRVKKIRDFLDKTGKLSLSDVKVMQDRKKMLDEANKLDAAAKYDEAEKYKPTFQGTTKVDYTTLLSENSASMKKLYDDNKATIDKFVNLMNDPELGYQVSAGFSLLFSIGPDDLKKIFDANSKLLQAENEYYAAGIEGEQTIAGLKYRQQLAAAKDKNERIADNKKTREDDIQAQRDYISVLNDIEREKTKNLKEANKEYYEWLANTRLETEQINIDANQNEWVRQQKQIEFEYTIKLDNLDNERDILTEKLKDDKDYTIKKAQLDNTYTSQSLALAKIKAQEEKILAAERMAFEVDTVSAMAGDISSILSSLGQESRGMQYTALLIDSATAIADVFVNFELAKAKGFGQLGPILGVPAATMMEVKKWVSIGAITARTIAGLAQINSSGKDTGSSGDRPDNATTGGRFALGGWIGGGSHQDGGVNINAEGGEFVVNKRAMMNPQIASFVNQANQYGNGGGNLGGMLTEERVAQIATSVLGAVPVYIVESEMTGMQRKVQIRESKFVK